MSKVTKVGLIEKGSGLLKILFSTQLRLDVTHFHGG